MNKVKLPQAEDWNHYWSLDQTKKFTKISWSKKRIITILQNWTGKGKHALDAGCGSGFFSKYFCDQEMETTALDYSDEALDWARKLTNGKAKVVKKDLVHDSLSNDLNERFDLIFSDGLLEHFVKKEQDKIIKNFISILSPDGVIVTFVPNRWSPWELVRPLFMPGIEETPFVLNDLVALNEQNALDVIHKGGINTIPFAFSPDKLVGRMWGMLLYTISKKR